ncbi:MAG: NADPH-dependent reductase [Herminiimonas sp.]|nr:NADPH-dependent reductase [Herminiimonas sp.]MDB5853956.1 NADPH-dependent reductase [Herminiimonas sp.]
MSKKIAIIGAGNVGGALEKGLTRAGYEVRTAKQGQIAEASTWADTIMVAVPFGAIAAVVAEIGNAANAKTIVDATNALTPDMQLAIGFTTSGAEELQKALPQANVVKSFNTVFAQHMSDGKVSGQQLSVFAAGDNAAARASVLELGRAIGFDAIDAGPLKNARQLEALGFFNIQLGYVLGNGPDIGFKLIH